MDIELYAKKIFRFAVNKTNNIQDAEDLSQEILISLFNSSEKINKVENVDAYVYRICQYTWSNFFRRNKRHWNKVNIDIVEKSRDINEIEELIEENEGQRLVLVLRKQLAYMTKNYREILVKYYFENKPIKDIAEELSLPQGTVKWYIHDAKRKLREDIGMENRIESFRPIRLGMGHSGTPGKNNEPASYFESLLYQNIAYAAYKEPLTIEEISRRLEVGCAFIEEALERLEYSDLVRKTGNKYQTTFFISEAGDHDPSTDWMIEKSSQIALPLYEAVYNVLDKVKKVGFVGCDLDDDMLMWTLYPYYVQALLDDVEDFREMGKAGPPERRDGGKYIASGKVMMDSGYEEAPGKYSNIYPRYRYEGIKTRQTESGLCSYQIDSYFSGSNWREFNHPDLDKLYRIAEIARYNMVPNEFEKTIIAEYASLGYLQVKDNKIRFNFLIMTREEKSEVDSIIIEEFQRLNSKEYLKGMVDKCYSFIKEMATPAIPDNDIRYKAATYATIISLGVLEYVERIGRLRTPTEEEKRALTTIVWKE